MLQTNKLRKTIDNFIDNKLKIIDFHTHLFPSEFGELCLFGIENILNYHYLHAEYLKLELCTSSAFFSMSQKERARSIWLELFINRLPFSEATKGIITILTFLGLPVRNDYTSLEKAFDEIDKTNYILKIFELANISHVVMTNDIFDQKEMDLYKKISNKQFYTSIRLDSFFSLKHQTIIFDKKKFNLGDDSSVEDYINYTTQQLSPLYFALSVDEKFSKEDQRYDFLKRYIFPIAQKYNIPISLMIGVKRGVNPEYRLAGDSVVNYNLEHLESIVRDNPRVKFCTTLLSRENQYQLTVLSRKFPNLLIFGSWWFLNNDIFIEEITRMRLNLLGNCFIPQHSDARILEQVIYKWKHTNNVFKTILYDYFSFLIQNGFELTERQIEEEIENFYNGQIKKIIKENKCITS